MNYKRFVKIAMAAIFIVAIVVLFSWVELYSQLGRYQTYWNNRNAHEVGQNDRLYIALGDSTAQGIGAGSADKGYVGLIAKELQKRTPDQPLQTINLSKSGAKIDDVLQRQLPEMQKQSVTDQTVITIEIGANNIINFDAQNFESQMDELMSKLPPQTVMSDIPYFGQSRFKDHEPDVIKANEIMYRLAAKHHRELVPLHETMKNNGGVKTFAADWFHPSSTAYRENWAPVFLSRIQ